MDVFGKVASMKSGIFDVSRGAKERDESEKFTRRIGDDDKKSESKGQKSRVKCQKDRGQSVKKQGESVKSQGAKKDRSRGGKGAETQKKTFWVSFFVWCHQESNRGHKDFQSFALPTEL